MAVALLSADMIRAERARRNFTLFVQDAWHVIEPSTPFVDGWHLAAICAHLQATSNGQIKRLLVNMPPRHCKSTLISTLWPVWSWLSDPSIRWLCASYALSLAIRDNRKCRLLIQSNWFQERYGHIFHFTSDQNVKGRFENDKRGYRLAVSVGSAATGEGGDILLIDDPHAIDDSTGDLSRLSTLEWFDQTWASRLNNQETGAMVVVGQRIHQQDLSGHILELGGWEHLNLPTEYESATRCRTSQGWSDPRTEEGQLLWPQRFSHATLARLKSQLGSIAYAAQYQQTPVPSGGGTFKKQWLRYADETPDAYILEASAGPRSVLKDSCWRFGTIDLAISSKQTADYTVLAIWDVTPSNDLILVALLRARLDNPEQLKQLRLFYQRYRPDYFRIERVGYQLALIQQALAEGIPCREYAPVRDKVSRASTPAVWMENEKVFLLKTLTELPAIETELLTFPKAAHDDIVDNFSMAGEEITAGRIPLQGEETPVELPVVIEEQIEEWQADPFAYAASRGMWGDG